MTRMRDIVAAGWDIKYIPKFLVVIDEAHHARRRQDDYTNERHTTRLYALADRLAKQHQGPILPLTATPMQIHDSELFYLVRLIDPRVYFSP